MKSILLIFCCAFSSNLFAETNLPSQKVRDEAFSSLISTIQNLDGEALYVRSNRPTSWDKITETLRKEVVTASSWQELTRPFVRLDQSYPNLHSYMKLGENHKHLAIKRTLPKVKWVTEWLETDKVRHVVSEIDPSVNYNANELPQVGDELIAINTKSMDSWAYENFEFCKLPLKGQCDAQLSENFRKEYLSWTSAEPLTYTLRRGSKIWQINVESIEPKASLPIPTQQRQNYCRDEKSRYQEGFELVYTGNRACVYQSKTHPNTAILRITSFSYSKQTLEENEQLTSVEKEVSALYPWWSAYATWDHLVIDVIENYGGQAPIEYYQLLFQHAFQEQYVTFKKTKEIEDPILRKSIFWGSPGQEIWFQNLVTNLIWSKLPYGEYSPPVPMFCVDENEDCSKGLFPVRIHPFKGRVSVLLNEWCVSSCDGFVYSLQKNLPSKVKVKFYGHPQSADTGYSRLRLDLSFDEKLSAGYQITIAPIDSTPEASVYLSQTIVVSQSTWEDGEIVSGKPVPLDKFVPITLQNKDSWPNEVLKQAL